MVDSTATVAAAAGDAESHRYPDHEVAMVRAALPVGALLAVILTGGAYLVRGTPEAALTALGAVAFVIAIFALTGWSHAWAARRGAAMLQGVALGGLLARLAAYAVLIVALADVTVIDGATLAVAAGVATVVVLAFEVRYVLRTSVLWFVDADARTVGATGTGKERA